MATKGKTGQVTALNNKWPALKQPLANAAVKEGKLTKDSTNKELYDSLSKVIKAAVADLYNTPQTDPRLVSIVRTIIAYVNGAVKQQIEDNSAIQDIVDNTSKDAISTIVEKAVEVAIKQNATSKDQTGKLADAIAKSVVKAISASKDKEKHDKLLADIKSMLEQQTSNTTTSSNKIETKTSTAKTSTVNLKSINDVLKKLMKICDNMQKLQTNISKNTNFIVKKLDATHIISTKMKKQVEQTTKIQQQIQTTTDEGFKSTNDNIEKVNNAVEEVNENIKNIQSGSLLSDVLGGSAGLAFKALGFIGKLVLAPAKFLFKWILKPIFGFVGGAIGGLLKGVSSILLAPIKLIGKGIGKVLDSIANVAAKSFGAFIMTPAGQYTIGFIAGFVWEMWLKDIYFWFKDKIDAIRNFFKSDVWKNIKSSFLEKWDIICDWTTGFVNDIKEYGINGALKRLVFGENADTDMEWKSLLLGSFTIWFENWWNESTISMKKLAFDSSRLIINAILSPFRAVGRFISKASAAIAKSTKQLFAKSMHFIKNIPSHLGNAAKNFGSMLMNAIKKIPGIGKLLSFGSKAAKAVGSTAKIAGTTLKAAGKVARAIVPGIGLITGTVDAVQRVAKGDYSGAAIALGSGALSLIPGIGGAAASIAADVGLMLHDKHKKEKQEDLVQNVDEALEHIESIPNNLVEKAEETNQHLAQFEDYSAYSGWTFIDRKWHYDGVEATKEQNDAVKTEVEETKRRRAASKLPNIRLSTSRDMPKIAQDDFNSIANAALEAGIPSAIVDTNNNETLAKNIANYLFDAQQQINAMPADEQRTWQSRLMDIVMKIDKAVNERSAQQNNYLFMEQSNQTLWNADRIQ